MAAAAESVDSLFMTLGLNLADLESGFVAAGQTVRENMQRLNRENNLIRLRAEVEIAGLDETADAERILQIRQDALNQQMSIQRDRVRLLDAEFRRLAATHGTTNAAVQRAEVRLERERLALANLERESRRLNDTTGESSSVFDELSNMLPEIPTKLGLIGAAAGVAEKGITAAADSVQELLENFRELQNQSYELNMSFPDTKNFLRQMKLGGGDIGDFEGYIRGITDAYVKGEYDDPEFVALRKYGARITDATGRLKDFKDITDEVYQAWKKADEAGEGIEFLQLTGGEAGVRDAIQFFKRYQEAQEDAAKIYDANLNEDQLHELDRTFGRLEEQTGELKSAFGNLFTPLAQSAGEKFFGLFHDGTQILVENTDAIQRWGFIVSEVIDTLDSIKIGDTDFDFAISPGGQIENAFKAIGKSYDMLKKNNHDAAPGADMQKYLDEQAAANPFSSFIKAFSESDLVRRAEERWRAFKGELSGTGTAAENAANGIDKTSDSVKESGDVLSQYGIQRAKQFKDELADIQIDLQFGDDEYGKSKAQNDLWLQRELTDKLQVSNEEREALYSLHAAKTEQIEREHQEKLAQIRQEAEERANQHFENAADIQFRMTHSAFEKELRDIENWKEAQQEKAETAEEIAGVIAESASKEAEAFANAVDKIKGKVQSLEDKIFAQEHSQYEQDLRRAQQEYYRQYNEFQKMGALDDETKFKLDYWYTNEVNALNRKANKSRANDDDYLKRPEGTNGQTLNLGLFADEQKIQQQLSQQLSDEGQDLVDKMYSLSGSAQSASEAQDSLAQSAQQASDSFQKIEGDRLANDIQNLSTSTQKLTDLQGQLAEATKSGISALQNSAQGTATKSVNPLVEKPAAQNHFAEKLREQAQHLKGNSDETTPVKKSVEKSAPITVGKSRDKNSAEDDRNIFEKLFSDNRDDTKKNFSPADAGKSIDLDLSEMLTPLKNLVEDFKSVWQQSEHGDKQPADPSAEISQEAASKFGEELAAPIKNLVQELQTKEKPSTDDTPEKSFNELIDPLNKIDGGVQSILSEMQATKTESTEQAQEEKPEIDLSEIISPLGTIRDDVKSIFEKMQAAETTDKDNSVDLLTPLTNVDQNVAGILQELQNQRLAAEETTTTETVDYLTPLTNIRDNVAGMWNKMSTETKATEQAAVPQQENLREIFAPVIANINTPLAGLLAAIDNKKIELPKIEFPVETIVKPLDSISSMVSKIVDLLSKREPPKVEISPSMDIDLGGAYVFDDALKRELVEDITSSIVNKITAAVERATSRVSYG